MNREPDESGAAEEQLLALLELLRAEGIEPSAALTDAVMRTVQWQVFVRGTIVLIGDLVGSMAAALALFVSGPARTGEDRE